MDGAALLGQVLGYAVAWTLAWSGTAKLLKPQAASAALANFGLTANPRVAYGLLVGGFECSLGLAIGLLSGGARVVVIGLAAMLLWFLTILLVRAVRGGASFNCFCFGSATDPVSYRSVLRTAGLAVAASLATFLAVFAPDPGHIALGERIAVAVAGAAALGGASTAFLILRLLHPSSTWEHQSPDATLENI
jgi:hypothetical protein